MARRAVACWGSVAAALLALQLPLVACGESGRAPRRSPAANEAGQGGTPCAACGGESGDATSEGGAAGGAEPASGGEPTASAGAPPAVPALTLREITIVQSVELPLMVEQATVPVAERNAPLIAGKRAMVRALVDFEPGFEPRPLLGVLDIENAERGESLVSERTLLMSSDKDILDGSFVFELSASDLGQGTTYRLRVLEADTTPLVQFPESGYAELGARGLRPFELVLVPMTVNGHAPKLGEGELAALRSRLLTLTPAPAVELSVAEGLTVDYSVSADGEGWDQALDDLLDHRWRAKPKPNVFYYGVMAPAPSYSSYCDGSCVLGLSNVADRDVQYERGSIGVAVFPDGSGDREAWDTLVHELGHALGRDHADCGEPDGPDPHYPYPNAGMGGVYGFDFGAMKLIKPKAYRDVMSYCTPIWISDYTYSALFERLAYLDSEAFGVLSWSPPEIFRVARVDRHGRASWRAERRTRPSRSGLQSFALLDELGRRVGAARARVARRDHLPSKSVWIPVAALQVSGARAIDLSPVGAGVLPL